MLQAPFLPTLRSLLTEPGIPLIQRDLSWLQFNDRVLSEARQTSIPLLERVKFLSITAGNLDEFFMIRLSSMSRNLLMFQKQAKTQEDKLKYRRLWKVRESILEAVAKFGAKQSEALDLIIEALEAEGISIVTQVSSDEEIFKIAKLEFESQVLPYLGAPETFITANVQTLENLQMAAIFKSGVWFRIPKSIPTSFVVKREATGGHVIFFLDDLLSTFLGNAFHIEGSVGLIRLTRDADVSVDLEEEDPETIPDLIRTSIKSRDKTKAVRLQYRGDFKDGILDHLMKTLKLRSPEVIESPVPLTLNALWSASNQLPDDVRLKKELAYPPLQPSIPVQLRDTTQIFEHLKKQDFLLHHPYDSFDAYVSWIKAACDDPLVSKIEQTIYRMDVVSPVIELLKEAATRKKIRVVIELRARFDEMNNLKLTDELRKAGVEVYFGFAKLKLHAKVALVTRTEEGVEKLYTHLSTGNYHAATARAYTDLAIITSNNEIGIDAKNFFEGVCQGKIPSSFKRLLSAPLRLHKVISGLIDNEIEAAKNKKPARIVAKVNALVDGAIIEKLYLASQAGVKVDLIVRGACSLIPGVKGLSENITVISVVDRFLEHSRIYLFENSQVIYLSSADWMPRNFFSRLELAFPILDARMYDYIHNVLIPAYLNDSIKGKELTPQGTWKKRVVRGRGAKIRSQFYFDELAKKEYVGTPLEIIVNKEGENNIG